MSDRATSGRLGAIEACRGLAATAVVLYHASRHLDKTYGVPMLRDALQFGHAGVDLFFVISGFIILYVHYRDIGTPARLPHYVGRRFTRVLPTYWVALTLTILLASGGHKGLPSLSDLFWSITLAPSDHNLILGIAWTLRFELAFYVFFCILILNRIAGLAVLAIWLAAILAAAVARIALPGPAGVLTGAFNLEFFFGMTIAYTLRNTTIPVPRLWLAAGVSLFAAAAVVEGMGLLDGYADYSRLIYGIPSALIILGAAEAGRQGHLAIPAPLRVLGAASYSIYLFQFVFIGIFWQAWLHSGLDRWTPHAASFLVLAGAGVGGGIIMSGCVEHPLIRLVRGDEAKVQPRAAIG
jgi:exopolysaccharide production protein ExoZ